MHKLDNKGQAGGITTILLVVVMMMVGVVIISNITNAFSTLLTWTATYSGPYNNTVANGTAGMNLGSLLPIILGAGILIGAVMLFARTRQ